VQRYFGTAVGKGRQAAKTEIERLKLGELSCEQGVNEVAKMCAPPPPAPARAWRVQLKGDAGLHVPQPARRMLLCCHAFGSQQCYHSCTSPVLPSLVRALSAAPARILDPAVRR